MITFIRRMFASRIGIGIALAFLVIVGFAFALSDVNRYNHQGSVAAGYAARVGDQQISLADLRQRIQRAYEAERQNNPQLTLQQFVNGGAFDRILKEMTDIYALHAYARDIGINIDKTAIDAIIARNPAFAGLNGNFDQKTYEAVLQRSGTTPAKMRTDLEIETIVRQFVAPTAILPSVPRAIALPYASLLLEERRGQAVFIPASQLAPAAAPSEAALNRFYSASRARYLIPERRAIRYALLDEAAVRTPPAVTPAEIEAEYRANASQYAAKESRRLSQVIASSRAAADRVVAAARAGRSLADAAQSAGLAATPVTAASQSEFAASTNPEVARAVFAASDGSLVGPLQVPLGWIILHIDGVDRQAARPLASVSDALATTLRERKKQEAMVDLFNRAQDALNGGAPVTEVAQDLGLQIVTTPAMLPDGSAPGAPDYRAPPFIRALLSPAFQAGDGDPGQVVTLQQNRLFALLDVAQVVPAAPPPLASVRDRVVADWRQDEGNKAARARARQILAAVERGSTLADAARTVGSIGTVQAIGGRRLELTSREGRIPPELALLFSMARGTAKTLELPGRVGWMVLRLDTVTRGDASGERNAQLIAAVQQQFGQALAGEYVDVLVEAARAAHPVTLNRDAVRELREQLGGATPTTVN